MEVELIAAFGDVCSGSPLFAQAYLFEYMGDWYTYNYIVWPEKLTVACVDVFSISYIGIYLSPSMADGICKYFSY